MLTACAEKGGICARLKAGKVLAIDDDDTRKAEVDL